MNVDWPMDSSLLISAVKVGLVAVKSKSECAVPPSYRYKQYAGWIPGPLRSPEMQLTSRRHLQDTGTVPATEIDGVRLIASV